MLFFSSELELGMSLSAYVKFNYQNYIDPDRRADGLWYEPLAKVATVSLEALSDDFGIQDGSGWSWRDTLASTCPAYWSLPRRL